MPPMVSLDFDLYHDWSLYIIISILLLVILVFYAQSELICGHLAIWKDTTTGQLDTNRDLQGLTIDVQDALVAAGEPQLVEDNIFSRSAGASNTLNVHGTDVEGAWGFVVNFLVSLMVED